MTHVCVYATRLGPFPRRPHLLQIRLHLSACPLLSFTIPTMSTDSQLITNSIRRRLADLQTYQLPRLRDCKGPIDLQRDLSAELKDDIRKIKRNIDVSVLSSRV
jgi:hypothetical protein